MINLEEINREELADRISGLLTNYLIYDAWVDGDDVRVEVDWEKTSNLIADCLIRERNRLRNENDS